MIKHLLKYLGILLAIMLLLLVSFVWINVSGGSDKEELLLGLPGEVTPKYRTNEENNWWKETTVYQIYPRSYMDSDADGIGDINGIISKLDYIQSLGFETIWLSPFFKSPQEDHGYDVSDYLDIQAEYGNLSTVDSLIAEVHKRDMKIVFDMVLNHTSDQHPWFLESKRSSNNPKSDWYVWKEGTGDGPPNNWKNIIGQGSAWTYVPERDQYYYAAFLPFQPDLNMANPEVKAEIFRIIRYWLDKGVDGFRLDIFNFIFEDQSFSDNPFTLQFLPRMDEGKWVFEDHRYNFHQPEVIAFAKELRSILESYPDGRFMVGEVFGSHRHMRELLGMDELDGLNLVFLFDFLDEFEFSADYFREKAEEYELFYPDPMNPTYVFSNHDQFRSITRLGDDPRKADVLATFQLTMRGVPFVYQGEEIGMTTGTIDLEEAQDPLARGWIKFPKWLRDRVMILMNRDNCRTPMQWSDQLSGGFSTSPDTWLPVEENYTDINVERQWKDDQSLLSTYKQLLQIRKQYPYLASGIIAFMDHKELPQNVLGYIRSNGSESMIIYLNFSNKTKVVKGAIPTNYQTLFRKRAEIVGPDVDLDPYGVMLIEYDN